MINSPDFNLENWWYILLYVLKYLNVELFHKRLGSFCITLHFA